MDENPFFFEIRKNNILYRILEKRYNKTRLE